MINYQLLFLSLAILFNFATFLLIIFFVIKYNNLLTTNKILTQKYNDIKLKQEKKI